MSYMVDRDHIAITSRDTSTTRRKVLVPGCPVVLPNTVTHRESSDTYRRIASVSEIVPGKYPPGLTGGCAVDRRCLVDEWIRYVNRHCRIVTHAYPAKAIGVATRSFLR